MGIAIQTIPGKEVEVLIKVLLEFILWLKKFLPWGFVYLMKDLYVDCLALW